MLVYKNRQAYREEQLQILDFQGQQEVTVSVTATLTMCVLQIAQTFPGHPPGFRTGLFSRHRLSHR